MSKYLHIGERLKEERERLELNQENFGSIGGASRKSQYNYENGERPPDAGYLASISEIGADVLYILTGRREKNLAEPIAAYGGLRPDQIALIDNVEHCTKEDQDAIKRMAFLAAKADMDETESGTNQKKA